MAWSTETRAGERLVSVADQVDAVTSPLENDAGTEYSVPDPKTTLTVNVEFVGTFWALIVIGIEAVAEITRSPTSKPPTGSLGAAAPFTVAIRTVGVGAGGQIWGSPTTKGVFRVYAGEDCCVSVNVFASSRTRPSPPRLELFPPAALMLPVPASVSATMRTAPPLPEPEYT